MFDVAVIGGGPAGLSALVNAACEGLESIMIAEEVGGRAGTSSRIENFLGFPDGISGPSLTQRATRQATKFGAIIHNGRVDKVRPSTEFDGCFSLELADGARVRARSLIVACGATYIEPEWAKGMDKRKGVHYACTAEVVRHSGHETVAVIGGANSAGQAATFLAGKVKTVHLILRSNDLAKGMSYYLYDRIRKTPNIQVHYEHDTDEILKDAKGHVRGLHFTNGTSIDVSDVYVMIGAKPNCHFLDGLCDVDDKGFIKTTDMFKTSCDGIYAVGDIRSGSIKRVANAAGEGAACIQPIFSLLNPTE